MRNVQFDGQDPDAFREWLRAFFPEGKVYRSDTGQTLIVFEAFQSGNVTEDKKYLQDKLFLREVGDGRFLQLQENGSGGTVGSAMCHSCEDRDGKSIVALVGKDVATIVRPKEGRPFDAWAHFSLVTNQAQILKTAVFVPLPEIRQPEYLFLHPDGRVFYVDATKYGYSYEGFRCFAGPRGALSRVVISDVGRYRDGGSTFVNTDAGILFSPAPMGDGDKRSFWLPVGTDTGPFNAGKPVSDLPGAVEVQQIPCRGSGAILALPYILPV